MVKKYIGIVSCIIVIMISLHAMEDDTIELRKLSQELPSINTYASLTETTFAGINEQRSTLLCANTYNQCCSKKLLETVAIGCTSALLNFALVTAAGAVGAPCCGYSAKAVVCSSKFLCANAACSQLCFVCPFCLCNLRDICCYYNND